MKKQLISLLAFSSVEGFPEFDASASEAPIWHSSGSNLADGGKNMIYRILIFLLGMLCVAHSARAGAGGLDSSFGSGGIATSTIGSGSFDQAFAAALQSDGKIVVVGDSATNHAELSDEPGRLVVARVNADGSLDNTFGLRGKASKWLTGTSRATAVAIQPDGKIVIGGYTTVESSTPGNFVRVFLVARFGANGLIDASFGSGGIATTNFDPSTSAIVNAICIQGDGKIVAVGYNYFSASSPLSIAVARYGNDGSPDQGFGTGGKTQININPSGNRGNAVALQSDGKILIGGSLRGTSGSATDFALVRLNVDGSLDGGFDSDGKVVTKIGTSTSSIAALAVQPDGKILAGGNSDSGTARDIAVARYNADGSLDSTFDSDGIVVTDVNQDILTSIRIQSDGKVIVGGQAFGTTLADNKFLSVRYNANGSLDNSYNGTGIVSTQVATLAANRANALLIQTDGKIVLAGTSNFVVDSDFSVARYNANGTPDPSFGDNGTSVIELASSSDILVATALQSDGKIVAVGDSFNALYKNISIARFLHDGRFDTSFGTNGSVILPIPNESGYASDVVVQPDGKIVVSADSFESGGYLIIRLNADGTADTSFGDGGTATVRPGTGGNAAYCLALQPDGKIVAAGQSYNTNGIISNSFARLNSNGSLDAAFGSGGTAMFADPNLSDRVNSIAVDSQGRIVAGAGATSGSSDGNQMFAVLRLSPNGSLDSTFGGSGIVHTAFDHQGNLYGVAIQADGKIVAAGYGFGTYALARYNQDGSLDATFDGDGKVTTLIQANTYSFLRGLVIQKDGRMVVAGDAPSGPVRAGSIIRYNVDGSLDASFGNGGKVITPVGEGDSGYLSVLLDSDGKIVAGGYSASVTDYDFTLVRYDAGTATKRTAFDFDGDGKADLAVRRPSDNVWYFLRTTAGYTGLQYGEAGDLMAPADYDGDGKADVAVFRPSTGTWFIAASSVGFYTDNWGADGDIPVPADYDGDGKADIAVYRPSNGTWYRKLSSGALSIVQFGTAEDKPQLGDFDGDGKADLAVVRPSNNTWYFLRTTAGFTAISWGTDGDISSPADFDGDGKTDPAVFRPSSGEWFIAGSTAGFSTRNWGAAGDIPVTADYDGDGKADVAVFRPSNNTWYISASSDGIRVTKFGENSDKPIHSSFNY